MKGPAPAPGASAAGCAYRDRTVTVTVSLALARHGLITVTVAPPRRPARRPPSRMNHCYLDHDVTGDYYYSAVTAAVTHGDSARRNLGRGILHLQRLAKFFQSQAQAGIGPRTQAHRRTPADRPS